MKRNSSGFRSLQFRNAQSKLVLYAKRVIDQKSRLLVRINVVSENNNIGKYGQYKGIPVYRGLPMLDLFMFFNYSFIESQLGLLANCEASEWTN